MGGRTLIRLARHRASTARLQRWKCKGLKRVQRNCKVEDSIVYKQKVSTRLSIHVVNPIDYIFCQNIILGGLLVNQATLIGNKT